MFTFVYSQKILQFFFCCDLLNWLEVNAIVQTNILFFKYIRICYTKTPLNNCLITKMLFYREKKCATIDSLILSMTYVLHFHGEY